jgi:hypothetical protein
VALTDSAVLPLSVLSAAVDAEAAEEAAEAEAEEAEVEVALEAEEEEEEAEDASECTGAGEAGGRGMGRVVTPPPLPFNTYSCELAVAAAAPRAPCDTTYTPPAAEVDAEAGDTAGITTVEGGAEPALLPLPLSL